MKRVIIAAMMVAAIAVTVPASAQDADDIGENVIKPCIDHAVQGLGLDEQHLASAALVLSELSRNFYEGMNSAVEAALTKQHDRQAQIIYAAGLQACIAYQDQWFDHGGDRDVLSQLIESFAANVMAPEEVPSLGADTTAESADSASPVIFETIKIVPSTGDIADTFPPIRPCCPPHCSKNANQPCEVAE